MLTRENILKAAMDFGRLG